MIDSDSTDHQGADSAVQGVTVDDAVRPRARRVRPAFFGALVLALAVHLVFLSIEIERSPATPAPPSVVVSFSAPPEEPLPEQTVPPDADEQRPREPEPIEEDVPAEREDHNEAAEPAPDVVPELVAPGPTTSAAQVPNTVFAPVRERTLPLDLSITDETSATLAPPTLEEALVPPTFGANIVDPATRAAVRAAYANRVAGPVDPLSRDGIVEYNTFGDRQLVNVKGKCFVLTTDPDHPMQRQWQRVIWGGGGCRSEGDKKDKAAKALFEQ